MVPQGWPCVCLSRHGLQPVRQWGPDQGQGQARAASLLQKPHQLKPHAMLGCGPHGSRGTQSPSDGSHSGWKVTGLEQRRGEERTPGNPAGYMGSSHHNRKFSLTAKALQPSLQPRPCCVTDSFEQPTGCRVLLTHFPFVFRSFLTFLTQAAGR